MQLSCQIISYCCLKASPERIFRGALYVVQYVMHKVMRKSPRLVACGTACLLEGSVIEPRPEQGYKPGWAKHVSPARQPNS